MLFSEFKSIDEKWKIVKVSKQGLSSNISKTYRIISNCKDINRQSPYINYMVTVHLYLYWENASSYVVVLCKQDEEFEDDDVSRMEVIKSIPKEYLHLIFNKAFSGTVRR